MVSIETLLAGQISELISECFSLARARTVPLATRIELIEKRIMTLSEKLGLLRSLQHRNEEVCICEEVSPIISNVFNVLRQHM